MSADDYMEGYNEGHADACRLHMTAAVDMARQMAVMAAALEAERRAHRKRMLRLRWRSENPHAAADLPNDRLAIRQFHHPLRNLITGQWDCSRLSTPLHPAIQREKKSYFNYPVAGPLKPLPR